MQVVIVGNGLSGTILAKTLRELDPDTRIVLLGDEKHLYYPRPNLIEYLAGNLAFDRLFAFSEEWYGEQRIELHRECSATRILRDSRAVETQGGDRFSYDRLVLANGAYASIPPFKGTDKRGIFTLRTLDDAQAIQEYMEDHPRAAVIGGGLLGLEIARALHSRGGDVDVYEFFPRLLPRQLDTEGADVLRLQIEKLGIRVHLDVATEEILGDDEARGLRFQDGGESSADMVVVAAGVRPRIELARDAGLETDKGIVVDNALRTSDPNIFAAGDSVQHDGRIYGIIPASFQQARTAAHTVLGLSQAYEGTVWSNTLKVVGVNVTSIGMVTPEPGETAQEFRRGAPEKGTYKKIVIQDGRLIGAIWMGTKTGVNEINRLVSEKADVSRWMDQILDDGFDFGLL
jgi:nitrite reductase (NADH) large subunit